METEEFAATVKEFWRRMGLSQEKLAAEAGVTASTVNRWENEGGKPSPLAVKQIGFRKPRFGPCGDARGAGNEGEAKETQK